jgi:hypothetical protein
MRRLFAKLYAVTLALHALFFVAAQGLLEAAGVPLSWPIAATAALALALLFHGRVALQRWDRPIGALRRLCEEAYFVHWMALVLAVPLWIGASALLLLQETAALGRAAGWAYLAALLVSLAGVVVARRRLRIARLDVAIEGLPAAFDGYRIAQLSDLHVGSLCPRRFVDRWVASSNALDADLVALTGDYVTTGVRFHEAAAAALGGLRARDGVYAVMGNHDYFGDGEPLMTRLREAGIVLLHNERVRIERAGAALCLAGIDDVFTRRADVDRALDGREEGLALVVLAHDPQSFRRLSARGAALVLSGHTHWGQIAVPFLAERYNLARLFMRHSAGTHRRGDAVLHVSPGLGTTGLPFRLGVPPTITLVTLRRAPPTDVAAPGALC